MMLAKPEGSESNSTMEASSSNDREKDLERRLANLGNQGHSSNSATNGNTYVNEERQPVATGGDNLLSFEGLTLSGGDSNASSSSKPASASASASAPTTVKPNKNALLVSFSSSILQCSNCSMYLQYLLRV